MNTSAMELRRAKALLKHCGYRVIKDNRNKILKHCKFCSTLFETSHNRQIYCGRACRYAHYQLIKED